MRKRYGRGGLSTAEAGAQGIGSGVARATNLANGDGIPLDTIRQMGRFFSRHRKNYRPGKREADGGPTAGTIAWDLWGGEAGRLWAARILREQGSESTKSQLDATNYRMADTPLRSCGTCAARSADGRCTAYNMACDERMTCDGWRAGATKEAREPSDPPLWQRAMTRTAAAHPNAPEPFVRAAALRWYAQRGGRWTSRLKHLPGQHDQILRALIDKFSSTKAAPAPASFAVFKQADGRYRWVTRSSNAFRDRDREIVSTKALADDVAHADRTGEYGPLRFWHMPGVDVGDCDFNMLYVRTLIESGTFRNPQIARKIARVAGDYQISIGFRHPPDEPDENGVFHTIRRFERSLVPAGRAANPFTSLVVKEKRMNTDQKVSALKALLDGDEAQLREILAGAQSAEKTAESMGVAFKEKDLNRLSIDELLDYAIAAKEKQMAEDEPEPEKDDGYSTKMGDYVTKMGDYVTKMGGYCDRMEKMLGSREKAVDAATAAREAADLHSTRIEKAEQQLATLQAQLAEATKALKELTADVPPGVAGHRPTASPDTVVEDAEAQVETTAQKSAENAVNGFLSWIVPDGGAR